MDITPEALAQEFSLTTAATRLDFLSRRDTGDSALNTAADADEDDWSSIRAVGTSLDVQESLELLALGEVVARKAHRSRLLGMRAALRGGADWAEIAAALGVTPTEAWDAFHEALRSSSADEEIDAESARALAGARPA